MRRSQVPVKGQVQVWLQMQVQGQVISTKSKSMLNLAKAYIGMWNMDKYAKGWSSMKNYLKKNIIYKSVKEKQKHV